MRMKRKLEAATTLTGLFLTSCVVLVWLWLVLQGRDPPKTLMILAVVTFAGAIGAAYKKDDIREGLAAIAEAVPLKLRK